jgi:formylglycine-generating enzyme required for sulfatase activity
MSAKHYPLSSVQRYNCFDGYVYTAPVGSFSPNAFGLYDMLGNVQQWVEDCWHENYVGAPSNGLSWSSKSCPAHVLRGTRFDMGPEYTRYYYRTFSGPSVRDDAIGFRVARDN